ncbi:MAG: S8 family serine peptidase [Pirellulaceae bacterium]|nr:S8 family serine peptidase [Pirellulaceae bacterium]
MACSRKQDNTLPESSLAIGQGVEHYLPELTALWPLTRGVPDVCVAVLDGPIDCQHPALEGANLKQLDSFTASGRQRGLPLLHGTHVASLIFGQHPGPFRGVAPHCRGIVIPVFDERDDGSLIPCPQLDLARAISLAIAVGANVINISGGRNDPTGQPEPVLTRALELCSRQGILVVAAAGNDGCRCLHVPAAAPTVLAVGATDRNGQPWEQSNWGDSYQFNGLLAPGQDILGAVPGGELATFSGTSLATALVSGVAALLMSTQATLGRPVDAATVRAALIDGARQHEPKTDGDPRTLAGVLNIAKSLTLLLPGELPKMSHENRTIEAMSSDRDEIQAAPPEAPTGQRTVVKASPPRHIGDRTPVAESGSAKEGCGCRGGDTAPAMVYALGLIDYDFGTEARRDAFMQRGLANPADQRAMLAHITASPWEATGVTWTLLQETTPIYAVQPAGPFAAETHQRLRELLNGQLNEGVTQVSIPGILVGSTLLMNGQRVPMIYPDIRGMYSWSTTALIDAVLGPRPSDNPEQDAYDRQVEEIANFLERVYYELSNLGVAPQERAINYAATNLFQVAAVYRDAVAEGLRLDSLQVERSSLCRPGSDCWDVKLTLFDPVRRQERAKEVFRLTVDVSEILPVTVGKLRKWAAF